MGLAVLGARRLLEDRTTEVGGALDRKDRVPFLDRKFLELCNVLDPRVVNEDVEPAEIFDRFRYQIRNLAGLRHVGAMVNRADAEVALDGGNLGGDCIRGREAVEHDTRARMSAHAMPRPIPPVEPVTTATLPSSVRADGRRSMTSMFIA